MFIEVLLRKYDCQENLNTTWQNKIFDFKVFIDKVNEGISIMMAKLYDATRLY